MFQPRSLSKLPLDLMLSTFLKRKKYMCQMKQHQWRQKTTQHRNQRS